jgi:deoxycytidylate deaminase|tara:strand:- start:196 stop:342 length:147 start_codon:yes stop_codon:yes gene_type:complete
VDCTKKITDAGIRRIVYVDKNGELTSTKVCDYHATQITSGRRFLAGID